MVHMHLLMMMLVVAQLNAQTDSIVVTNTSTSTGTLDLSTTTPTTTAPTTTTPTTTTPITTTPATTTPTTTTPTTMTPTTTTPTTTAPTTTPPTNTTSTNTTSTNTTSTTTTTTTPTTTAPVTTTQTSKSLTVPTTTNPFASMPRANEIVITLKLYRTSMTLLFSSGMLFGLFTIVALYFRYLVINRPRNRFYTQDNPFLPFTDETPPIITIDADYFMRLYGIEHEEQPQIKTEKSASSVNGKPGNIRSRSSSNVVPKMHQQREMQEKLKGQNSSLTTINQKQNLRVTKTSSRVMKTTSRSNAQFSMARAIPPSWNHPHLASFPHSPSGLLP